MFHPEMTELSQAALDEEARQFLRLCLRGRWEPAALEAAGALSSEADLNWESLGQVARVERVAPLLYTAVRNQHLVPPSVEEEWRRLYYATALGNTRRLHELQDVMHRLSEQGVAAILLKGAALAETVYRNAAVRPMDDLDLLVRRSDVLTALSVLASLGYRPGRVEASSDKLADWEMERALYKGEAKTWIDMHWSLVSNYYHQYTLPVDWFWQTALPARLLNVPCMVLAPEGQLLHLCAQLVYHDVQREEPRLLQLHDVAEVIVCYQKEIDWLEVLARAKAYDLVLPLQLVLARAVDEWRVPIPKDIREQLHLLRPSPTEARVFSWRTALRGPGVAENFWTVLVGMPGWQRRLAYAWRNLFPSPTYMRERYRIPHPILLPVYYPHRWLLGLRGVLCSNS